MGELSSFLPKVVNVFGAIFGGLPVLVMFVVLVLVQVVAEAFDPLHFIQVRS